MLVDFYRHQAWADAEHWRALKATAGALEDRAIRERLHHLHLVQQAFLWTARPRGDAFAPAPLDAYPDIRALEPEVREYHASAIAYVAALGEAERNERLTIAWFRDPPLQITREEALVQAAMHSHYHRGQNATRLRELGGSPPPTDLIVWWWKNRPEPQWE